MLNDIIDGVSRRLNEAFGDGYEVYTEQVKQGLQPPCFSVSCVNAVDTQVLGNRRLRRNLFSVKYFPASETEAKAECLDIQDRLFSALEYITAGGDLIRGTDMNGEFVDGVLVCIVSYNVFIHVIPGDEPMETLETPNIGARG